MMWDVVHDTVYNVIMVLISEVITSSRCGRLRTDDRTGIVADKSLTLTILIL